MEIKELKKEVESLTNLSVDLKKFQDNWLHPIRKNTNYNLPFIKDLDQNTKQKLQLKLTALQPILNQINSSQIIQDKLKQYSRYLVELKLSTFNGDQEKSKVISHQILNDDYLSLKQTLSEVKLLGASLNHLQREYQEINQMVSKNLTLEDSLFFMDLPHQKYLNNLLQTSKRQQELSHRLGTHLITMIKETQLKKR